jgi:hypothetical protein
MAPMRSHSAENRAWGRAISVSRTTPERVAASSKRERIGSKPIVFLTAAATYRPFARGNEAGAIAPGLRLAADSTLDGWHCRSRGVSCRCLPNALPDGNVNAEQTRVLPSAQLTTAALQQLFQPPVFYALLATGARLRSRGQWSSAACVGPAASYAAPGPQGLPCPFGSGSCALRASMLSTAQCILSVI